MSSDEHAPDDERRRLTDEVIRVQGKLNIASRQRAELLADRDATRRRHAEELAAATAPLERALAEARYERDVAQWKLASMQRRRWWRLGQALSRLRDGASAVPTVAGELVRIGRGTGGGPAPKRPAPPTNRAEAITAPAVDEIDQILAGGQPPARHLAAATLLEGPYDLRLSYEWVPVPLEPASWRQVLQQETPDLVVIDAHGLARLEQEFETPWTDVVQAFRDAGIPAVYLEPRRLPSAEVDTDILDTFDLVTCLLPETADAYRSHGNMTAKVRLAPPAVQTRIIGPSGADRRGDVVGLRSLSIPAGSGNLLAAVRRIEDIDVEVEPAGSPQQLQVSTAEVAGDYRVAVIELSEATDADEIRRVLEVAARRTVVVAGGIVPSQLDGLVIEASSATEVRQVVAAMRSTDELRDKIAQRTWRTIYDEHSVRRRVDDLLRDVASGQPSPLPSLTMMVPTNRPNRIEHALDNLARQVYPNLSALLVLHGVDIDEAKVRDLAAERGIDDLELLRVPAEVVLGDVFNQGFAACDTEFVGKMDDDDYYGPHYASDLMADREHVDADIVGKWAHYAYSEAIDATLLRHPESENTFTELLAISTLIIRATVLDEVSFPPMVRGSGSQFLRAAAAAGATVFSGNRFGYLYNRYSGDGHEHTWPIGEYELAARSRFICEGRNLKSVDA